MKKIMKFTNLFTVLAMLLQCVSVSAYTFSFDKLNDGAPKSESTIVKEFKLLDAESAAEVASAGLKLAKDIKKEGRTSTALYDNQDQTTAVNLLFPKNMLDYSYLEISFYTPKAYNASLLVYFESTDSGYAYYKFPMDKEGWTDLKVDVTMLPLNAPTADLTSIRKVQIHSSGWGLESDPEAKIYFQDIKLVDDGLRKNSEEEIKASWEELYKGRTFSEETQALAKRILDNTVAVHKNVYTVIDHGNKGILAMGNPTARMETIGGTDMVPAKFFEKYLNAELKSDNGICEIKIGASSVK